MKRNGDKEMIRAGFWKPITRRQFLITAGIGTAAAGAAAVGIGGLAKAEGEGVDSLIGAVKVDPESSYLGVPELLELWIKNGNEDAWEEIKQKIDYTYTCLPDALNPVLENGKLRKKILKEIKYGRKLFFKVNLVTPDYLSVWSQDGTVGLQTGVVACTDWACIAALMRFFHDDLGIRYYQMALGEAGSWMPVNSKIVECTPEALIEGRHGDAKYGGWCMYYVRKYLEENTSPHDLLDNPMNGYEDSLSGNYLTPGEATVAGKLMVYDLNNAEWFDRGRFVPVPMGDNYNGQIVIHKALVGDPSDRENYPGSIPVNVPMMKVHCMSTLTNCIKNFGIGGWPMCAGRDDDPSTHDWLYAYPADDPPGFKGGFPAYSDKPHKSGITKGGIYHDKWYVVEADDQAMPIRITSRPNHGLDGTMVDINLAIKKEVPCWLHVVDAVNVINVDHAGFGAGVAIPEGLIFASEDPVATDLLCARYMFKTVPKNEAQNKFLRLVPEPNWNGEAEAIISDGSVEEARASAPRATLFSYGARRGLGRTEYQVIGKDRTTTIPTKLVSSMGHFGRRENGDFVDIMTSQLYYHNMGCLWDLQPSVLALATASDSLDPSWGYYNRFMELDEDGDGVIDDLGFGKKGMLDTMMGVFSIGGNLFGKWEIPHGQFFMYSRQLKYAYPTWNTGNVDPLSVHLDSMAFWFAMNMSAGDQGKDPFFKIPFGLIEEVPHWPSLQFARYSLDCAFIYGYMYPNAQIMDKPFTLYVPNLVPYFPGSEENPTSYNPERLMDVMETDDPAKIFTVEFDDGEVW
jgi:hypothetical protein